MSAAAPARPGKATAWKLAVRLPTLPAAVAPVLVGTGVAIANREFSLGPALAAMAGALCLQVGANFANDVFDFRRGADTAERLGPPRATQMGLLTQREVFLGMALAFALAMVAGVYLLAVAGWPVVAAGVASIFAAVIYTGGPWPIGYHALGDVFTFVFFGLVAVAGTYFVQAGDVSGVALLASVPMGCTVTMILVVNNLRDVDTDRVANKKTLAVMIGKRATRGWYALLAAIAFIVAVSLWPLAGMSPAVLLVLGSLWFLRPPLRAVMGGVEGRPLNLALKATARFHLVFGLLFAAALALS
ncbi:MAG: 1,4-dihydroxy-2-naphthoate polyprenyltransferase [Dehalococcoidia bacterium]